MTPSMQFGALPAHSDRPNNAWYRMLSDIRVLELTPNSIVEGQRLAEIDLDFVERVIPLTRDSRILEIGCGWGRHALVLAQRGYGRTLSIDIAPAMLAVARRLADEAALTPEMAEADYVDLVPDMPFDAVLSLYDRSVLGWPSEAEDCASLAHLARMIRLGSYLLFGIRDWPVDLPRPSRDWHQTPLGLLLEETLPDAAAMTCTHRNVLINADGRREDRMLTRRHYSLPEVRRMLLEAGFKTLAAYHAFDEECPYGPDSHGLVVLARRAEQVQ